MSMQSLCIKSVHSHSIGTCAYLIGESDDTCCCGEPGTAGFCGGLCAGNKESYRDLR